MGKASRTMKGSFLMAAGLLLGGCGGGPAQGGPAADQPVPSPPVPSPREREHPPEKQRTPLASVSFTVVGDSIPPDQKMEELVTPFRQRMGEEIQEVIGEAAGVFSKAVPEGTLGNFAADAMLWAANRASQDSVHLAMTNNGGLRVPIGAGPITLGHMYELMPFENMLSVLVLSGAQVRTLCNELAEMRGEPIAGFTFQIVAEGDGWKARDIRVGGEPVDAEARYRLVTNVDLAKGGGTLTPIHSPLARQDLPVLLRDAFIEYIRFKGTIEPALDGRITGGIGR